MNDNFSQQVKDVITYSKEEALRLGHDQIGTEHLMLGILRDGEGKAISVLEALNVDFNELRQKIENLNPPKDSTVNHIKNLSFTKQAERALKTTFLEAKLFKSGTVNTIHLLLCILRNENDPITKLMNKFEIDYNTIKEEFKFQFKDEDIATPRAENPSFDGDSDMDNEFDRPSMSKSTSKTFKLKITK